MKTREKRVLKNKLSIDPQQQGWTTIGRKLKFVFQNQVKKTKKDLFGANY